MREHMTTRTGREGDPSRIAYSRDRVIDRSRSTEGLDRRPMPSILATKVETHASLTLRPRPKTPRYTALGS